jgi:hypothetical protein
MFVVSVEEGCLSGPYRLKTRKTKSTISFPHTCNCVSATQRKQKSCLKLLPSRALPFTAKGCLRSKGAGGALFILPMVVQYLVATTRASLMSNVFWTKGTFVIGCGSASYFHTTAYGHFDR